MKKFIWFIFLLLATSCQTINQDFAEKDEPEIASDQDNGILSNQLFKACTKTIANAHISTTIPGQIAVKGTLTCPKSTEIIIAKATITLLRKVNNSTYLSVGQKTEQITLSATGVTTIPQYKLVASSPCSSGVYRGKVETAYTNLSGVTIALSIPLFSPSDVTINCPTTPKTLSIAIQNNPVEFSGAGQYIWSGLTAYDESGNIPPADWVWSTNEQTNSMLTAGLVYQYTNPSSFASNRMGKYTLTASLRSNPLIKATTQVQVMHPQFFNFAMATAQLGNWSVGSAKLNPPGLYPLRCFGYGDIQILLIADGSIASSLNNLNLAGVGRQEIYKNYTATWDYVIQAGECTDPNLLVQDQLKTFTDEVFQQWKSQMLQGVLFSTPRMTFGLGCKTFWTSFQYASFGCYVVDLLSKDNATSDALKNQPTNTNLAPLLPLSVPPNTVVKGTYLR